LTRAERRADSRKKSGRVTPAPDRGRAVDASIAFSLVVAIFLAYAQTFHFGFVNYDDPDYVTANAHVQAGLTAESIGWAFRHSFAGNWFPLTWISHMLDFELFGLHAGRHHFTSVCLHAAASVLLFLVLRRITGTRWPSAMVAALFALHPSHVESVAWIAERKDVLSAFFWMLTLLAYAGYAKLPGKVRYGLALLAFGLGLMAKPMLVTLPLVLLLLDYWPLARGVKIVEKIPFFILSAATCVVTYLVHAQAGATESFDLFPPGLRVQNALVSYGMYIVKMFWPGNLAVFYPYAHDLVLPAVIASVALIAITFLASQRPYLVVGWLWYLITLVPVIGLLQVGGQARADRYTYIPMIGLSIMVVWGAAELLQRWPRVEIGLAGGVCAVCLVLTWLQAGYWQGGVSLFRHAVEVTQDNYIARLNLAAALNATGETAEASRNLAEAVRIRPQSGAARAEWGQLLAKQGKADEALVQLRAAEKLSPADAGVHFRLATVLADSGHESEAAPEFLETVRLDPGNADAYYNLGIARFNKGRFEEAVGDFSAAVKLNPDDASGHFNLGVALARLGRIPEAIAELKETVRINPEIPGAREALNEAIASQAGK
jgi:Flp pilus assembly protein TadD